MKKLMYILSLVVGLANFINASSGVGKLDLSKCSEKELVGAIRGVLDLSKKSSVSPHDIIQAAIDIRPQDILPGQENLAINDEAVRNAQMARSRTILEWTIALFGKTEMFRIMNFDKRKGPETDMKLIMDIVQRPECQRCFKLMLSLGYDVNPCWSVDRYSPDDEYPAVKTALVYAAWNKNFEIVKSCLAFGAKMPKNTEAISEETRRDFSFQNAIFRCLQELVGRDYVKAKLLNLDEIPYAQFFKQVNDFIENDEKFKEAAKNFRDKVLAENIEEQILNEIKMVESANSNSILGWMKYAVPLMPAIVLKLFALKFPENSAARKEFNKLVIVAGGTGLMYTVYNYLSKNNRVDERDTE